MSKVRFISYICDRCGAESPWFQTYYRHSQMSAGPYTLRQEGWVIPINDRHGQDLCPTCTHKARFP